MSLKNFHILFITAATLVTAGFGVFALRTKGLFAWGLVSLALTVALVVYGVWFWRKIRSREDDDKRRRKLIRPLVVGLVIWTIGTHEAAACSVCYGDAQGPLIDAARLGVWLLFGLVLAVQVGIVLFFLTLRRRAREFERLGQGVLDG